MYGSICQEEQESVTHLFSHYLVARIIWFSQCWGILSDKLNASNHEELINYPYHQLSTVSNSKPDFKGSICHSNGRNQRLHMEF